MAKKGFLDGYKTYNTDSGFGSPGEWRETFKQRMSKEDATLIITEIAQSPHEILGIKPGASPNEIKTAFRQLIRQWHPDLNQHRITEAETMSKKIIAAYTLLS